MGGRRPVQTSHNPLSRFKPSRTPGSLGRNDAGDPDTLTLRGDTPGSLGLNDDAQYDVSRMVAPMDFDYLVRHHESKSHLVESVRLSDSFCHHNFDRKIKVGNHLFDHGRLLKIFCPKNGDRRQHNVKEFGDHGSDPAKMRGSR